MPLQTYRDYTVDYRLRQFRRCKGAWENHGAIEFIDFRSDEGDQLLAEMLEHGVVPDEHLWRVIAD